MTALWGAIAAVALLWPDPLAGPLDGLPLDRPFEALLAGVVFPAIWWFHSGFLRTRFARAVIVALLAWKAIAAATFAQEGLCVRFEPHRPYVWDQTGAPHAWDVRADWRTPDPRCSAIMTRTYESIDDFPVWFFNLPPPDDNWPGPPDRPPGARTRMIVHGYVHAREAGTLRIEHGADMTAAVSIDGDASAADAPLAAGTHFLLVDAELTGMRWRFAPTWNGRELWTQDRVVTATATRAASLDVGLRPWFRWVASLLGALLMTAWLISALSTADRWMLAWAALASAVIAALVLRDHATAARWAIAALAGAAFVPVSSAQRTMRGIFLLVGVPWLAFLAASALPAIGRFVLYEWGNDYWMFQRFAYRIVMQGHWLEGGSPTFWFQPLYRWIAGLLHLVFGDSSVGEWFWDGACLLVVALFAFRVVCAAAGFRWGVVAAVLPLAVFVLGTPRYLIGLGLSEISSAGFVYLAALFAMRSRDGHVGWAVAAGVLATLAFFTRLNNLPMAVGTAVFAWPSRRSWVTARSAAIIVATIGAGVLLFAWRTWHYTGVFSVLHGTQAERLSLWQPGISLRSGLARTLDSVLMVLTVNDPPRFDPYALPVVAGAATAVLAMAGIRSPVVPMPAVLFFFAGIAGAFVARGAAYPGRFSVHILGVTCALALCGAAALSTRMSKSRTDRLKNAEAGN